MHCYFVYRLDKIKTLVRIACKMVSFLYNTIIKTNKRLNRRSRT